MKLLKRAIWTVSVIAIVLGLWSPNVYARTLMTFAVPPASSNVYAYWVSIAKAIQTICPEYQINVSETQGAITIIKRIRNGEAIVGNSMSNSDYDNYNGLGPFKNKPFKDVRIMWYFDLTPIQFIVAKNANIHNISDLNGVRMNPGGTGMSVAVIAKQILQVLDVKPKIFPAGQASASDALVNRQIEGTVKAGPVPDSYIMQIAANIPIDLISFSEEELRKINEQNPYLVPTTIPANSYKGVDHDVHTVQVMMGAQTTPKLSQEDGYKMLSAILSEEGSKIWENAYPHGAKMDVLKLSLDAKTPLHAGTVQFLKEKGYEIPDELIPPEYHP